jgi:hypothetical protein
MVGQGRALRPGSQPGLRNSRRPDTDFHDGQARVPLFSQL